MANRIVNGELVEMSPEEEAAFEATRPPVVVVPQRVSFRQAKTAMQLYPVGQSDLWTAANAAADAIADRTQRIKTQNLLRDSTEYDRQRQELIDFAAALGLDGSTLDQLFITAATL